MADSLCGPSNALQNFQKHASTDRSLQQDRLTTRQNQIHNFRSDAGQKPGLLDPEFEAFQAGVPPPNLLQYAPPSRLSNVQPQHRYLQPDLSTESLAWASEFQKLHVSDPHTSVVQHQPRPIHARPTASWHQEFQMSMQPSQPVQQESIVQQNYGFTPSQGLTYQPSYSMTESLPSYQSQTSQWKGKEKTLSEDDATTAAFEKEFEAHAAQLLQEHIPVVAETKQSAELKHDNIPLVNNVDESLHEQLPPWETMMSPELEEEILRELREEAEINKMDYPPPPDEPDELAETAGQLLEALSDNTSQKFKDSSFLSLMRKLRDREVRVEGDKMVDVDQAKKGDSNHDDHTIPPNEQDDDPGRDSTMAGALPPS